VVGAAGGEGAAMLAMSYSRILGFKVTFVLVVCILVRTVRKSVFVYREKNFIALFPRFSWPRILIC
jgi:Ni,Fe-hydrogenase I cytochrome b subunit